MDALDRALEKVERANTELYDLLQRMLIDGPKGTMTALEKRTGWSREWLRKIKNGERPVARRARGQGGTTR